MSQRPTCEPPKNEKSTRVLCAAYQYIERGWRPIPIPPRAKGPVLKAWPDLRITIETARGYFNTDSNIGLLCGAPSADLVCIDLDNDVAAELAPQFLPATSLIAGRGEKPATHWFYICPGLKSKSFSMLSPDGKPVNERPIVEILSTGRQVVVWPSVHPTGDRYDVLNGEAPATVDASMLRDSVERLYHAVLDKLGLGAAEARAFDEAAEPAHDAVDLRGWLTQRGVVILGEGEADGRPCLFVKCPREAAHANPNSAKDCAVWFGPPWAAKCMHQSCGVHSWREFRGAIERGWQRVNGAKNQPPRPTSTATDHEPKGGDGDDWTSLREAKGRTDRSNSRRFLKQHSDKVRFCFQWDKWLIWDGTRWKIDDGGAVRRLAMATADSVWMDAKECLTRPVVNFAVATSGQPKLSAMLKLAAADVPVAVDDLDANPWLLNCPNGTLDLRTGELRPHRREDNLTKLCPTNFNPYAGTYHWADFLESVLGFHQPTIDFMQRYLGYAITGGVSEQILGIYYGIGSNGKTTLLNAIQDAVGLDYTMAAPAALLAVKKNETHPTELADLFGKRFAVCQESEAGGRLAEALVKQITGGDRIRARRMREDFWQFDPTHKCVLCTNHKLRIRGTDHAIWRRIVLIPFTQRYWNPDKGETGPAELRQDKTLPAKLKAESEGILRWMVDGCLDWQRNGLQIPDSVRAATEEYRSEQDTLGRFVETCCLRHSSVRVKFSTLYDELEKWCHEDGDTVPTKRVVGAWLKQNGFREYTNNGRWYLGIALTADTSTE